jgi:hypothetical protein
VCLCVWAHSQAGCCFSGLYAGGLLGRARGCVVCFQLPALLRFFVPLFSVSPTWWHTLPEVRVGVAHGQAACLARTALASAWQSAWCRWTRRATSAAWVGVYLLGAPVWCVVCLAVCNRWCTGAGMQVAYCAAGADHVLQRQLPAGYAYAVMINCSSSRLTLLWWSASCTRTCACVEGDSALPRPWQ